MPAISQILTGQGCAQMGADFYFPPHVNPHLHIRVGNAATVVNTLQDIRPHVTMFLLTNIPNQANINLMPPHALGLRDRAFPIINAWGVANRDRAQLLINVLTGLGVDV
jgi:hypothetical protein